jgi:hypothetical protein
MGIGGSRGITTAVHHTTFSEPSESPSKISESFGSVGYCQSMKAWPLRMPRSTCVASSAPCSMPPIRAWFCR